MVHVSCRSLAYCNPISTNNSPRLIIICTWLGGATPHRIRKYLDGYSSLYPSSSILLITARFLEIAALPFSVLHARLAPARNAVIKHIETETEQPSILWHIFSHGGCNTAIQMALSLHHQRSDIDLSKHIGLLVLDCCPGDASFENAYRAAAYSLPSAFPARVVGQTLLYPTVAIINGLQSAGLMRSVKHLRAHLNDTAVLGTARRLYLYSKADQVVRWEDVEAHIENARTQRSLRAQGVAFHGSPHCALVRDHSHEYWQTIASHWDAPEAGKSPGPKL
ncbi:uncharacterized protein TRIVIDRAFT_189679 [Trichoderma virens Gv29-8]|uniref:Uncharacterized protein n=1 Tax=Hypocrea virens (strain Gv29-8 / FGSC 10586) TaxID=413071 RepID=G9MLU9_HYPVG|nr:uncharacterized protein TRIVIDRAFT_189679 [Trichoderma virens Gv29-8]EHK24323.1 hypothetical protein TRIVIDRAFT_189679 [Trichoderma virens Gv29-8]